MTDDQATLQKLQAAAAGDLDAAEELVERYREPLRRMVAVRLDRRLTRRIDASDIIQETCVEAMQRLSSYLDKPDMPFFLWLRFLTGQKIAAMHRHHLGVQARDAQREARPERAVLPDATAESMADLFIDARSSPSVQAMRHELRDRLLEVIGHMKPEDREILSMRHFEQLSNVEAARELCIDESTASKRYVRALSRLREVLGGADEETAGGA